MRPVALTLALAIPLAGPALAQNNRASDDLTAHNGVEPSGAADQQTVNYYSPEWASEARHDVVEAGYVPVNIQSAQAGNIFFTATRNGQVFTVVVTPDEKVYASTPLPENATLASNAKP